MVNEERFEKVKIPLDEESIKRITEYKINAELSRDNLSVDLEAHKKQIELDLFNRMAKLKLAQMEKELERLNKNIEVYTKQIRTKKMIQFKPKEIIEKSQIKDKEV